MISLVAAIVLVTGVSGLSPSSDHADCGVLVLGKHHGDPTDMFVGGANGGGIWIGPVGSNIVAGFTDAPADAGLITEFWMWGAKGVSIAPDKTPPDLILPVTPGERITIPPVTDEQRRDCGGAVS